MGKKFEIQPGRSESIALALLRHHPHEQEMRLAESAIAGLQSDILSSHVITPLVVMKEGDVYIVIDGNRRLKIANATKVWTHLKCEVLPPSAGDIDSLFVRLNAHHRTMRGNERMNFVTKLAPEKWKDILGAMPQSFTSRFRELERAIGRKELIAMGTVGKYGPDIISRVRPVSASLARFSIGIEDGDVVRWLIAHQAQNVVNVLIRQPGGMTRTQARRLEKAILEDEPYPLRKSSRRKALVAERAALRQVK